MNKTSSRILLVEDEAIIALIIEDLLTAVGHQVTVFSNGMSAWAHLRSGQLSYDVILLDRGLPDMDGLELLHRIKKDRGLAQIPVIMETAQMDKESVREGLNQGAYYYLTKPFQAEVLIAVVKAALKQNQKLLELVDSVRQAERPLDFLQNGVFKFRDLEEGRLLATYLARTCPEPERVIQGLQELFVNAVEHGNLNLSYASKGDLVLKGTWLEEVQRRLQLPEYQGRYVEVHFQRSAASLSFTIRDQGEGFDWFNYLDFSPDRAYDLHGRGIAMAHKLSFDQLEYQGNGNTVVATCYASALTVS
jgi:DNA-binding response OmpR family regulator